MLPRTRLSTENNSFVSEIFKMSFKTILASIALLAMVCLGADPQYQKPNIAYPVWETAASNHCGTSSFTCTY